MVNPDGLKRNNMLFQKSRGIAVQIDNPNGLHLIRAWGVDWPIEDFENIALTPEWLGRCGFEVEQREKIGKCWVIPIMRSAQRIFGICNITPRTFVAFVAEPGNMVMLQPIYFLHNAQNLYYEFTGEEITIKEPA